MDNMISMLMEQGIVVVSFVWLLKYTLETAKERETKLMDFMTGLKDELSNLSNAVTKLADDMDELKNDIRNKQ